MKRDPEIDERGILHGINLVLDGHYARLDDVPDDKLHRAYLLMRIEVLLRQHPEMQVFMCYPVETPA